MNRLTKLQIGWSGLLDSIDVALKNWEPKSAKNELACSNALADFLRTVLPEDSRVEREYRHEGTTCDICVLYKGVLSSDAVYFEVKRNLRKKGDYDRLVGQVEGLKPRKNKIIIVLVGDTDLELVGRLKDQFNNYIDGESTGDATLKIALR